MRAMAAVLSIIVLIFTLGCDGGNNTPTAPTPVAESTAAAPPAPSAPVSGATISGVLRSSAGAVGFGPSTFASTVTVQVVGTGVSAPVDASGRFELKGVPALDVVLRFSGGGFDASVSLGTVQSGQTIQLSITVSGSVGVINGDSRLSHGQSRELEGIIEALQAPNQIVVKNQVVEIGASTKIKRGSQLLVYADLAVGVRVHVRGATSVTAAGTVLMAEVIEVQTGDSEDDHEIELSGVIDAPFPVGGSCSALPLTFKVGGKLVKADASTVVRPSCAALAAGLKVEVEGLLQTDGSVLARKVGVEDAEEKDLSGVVSTLTGSCSALPLTLTVGTTVVTANTSTVFKPSCSALAVGVTVEVEGLLQPDGSLLARKVEVEDVEKEIEGVVGSPYPASGTCSALPLTFTVGTTVVTATASTVFKPSCAALAAGAMVEVEGLLQTGGSILAKRVDVEDEGGAKLESFSGSVTTLTGGSCGSRDLAFDVAVSSFDAGDHTRHVKTSSTTIFLVPCANIKAGGKVSVEGQVQPGNVVVATRVK